MTKEIKPTEPVETTSSVTLERKDCNLILEALNMLTNKGVDLQTSSACVYIANKLQEPK